MRGFGISAKALAGAAAALMAGTAVPAQAKWLTLHNDFTMYDLDGKAIQTRSGTLRRFDGTFYWYGSANRFTDQTCYSSTDLIHWTNKGVALQAASTNRMDVLYNDSTKQYVMYLKTGPADGTQLGIATSPTPDGKYTFVGNQLIHGSKMGDMSVWQDDDGKAYIAYVWDSIPGANSGGVSQHALAALSPDFLTVGKRQWLWNAGSREAPMLMKRRGLYYYFTSLTLWTESTETQYYTASNIGGPWTTRLVPMITPEAPKKNSWDTQCDFVFSFKGPKDTLHMYVGDRWEKPDPARLGDYVFLPMSFTAKDSALVNYYQDWEVEPDLGLWRPLDPKRNLALKKTATASSSTGSNTPGNATDSVTWKNYLNTKWMSAVADSQWIRVDLGSATSVNRVILKWDSAYAKSFKVQVGTDTSTWTDVYGTTKAGPRSVTDETFATVSARYVRVLGVERGNTAKGIGLYDFMVLNDTGVVTALPHKAGRGAASDAGPLARGLTARNGMVQYRLASAGTARLELVDGRGRLKAVLADGFRYAGGYEALLPEGLGAGRYIVRLTQDGKRLGSLTLKL